MKKYLFLSSALVMSMTGAHAADKIITSANTCTVDVLGVSDNNAVANTIATWDLIDYECPAGQYLLKSEDTLECTECPTGSYCPGGTYTVESENNGKNTCPTDYTSDAGAVGENECYMGCELACSTNVECPPHSNNCTHSEFKTTGRQYVDATCNAYPSVCPIADFGCDIGYSKTELTAMEVAEKFFAMVKEYDSGDSGLVLSSILFCDLEGNDGTPQSSLFDNSISDCDYVAPGHILLIPTDVSAALFMINLTKNEYNGADIPGAIKGDEKYLLRNADFKPGVTGDNMWIRFSNMFLPTPDTELVMRFVLGDLVPPQDATTPEKQLEWMSTLVSTDLMNKIQQNPSILNDQSGTALILATYRDVSLPNTWVTEVDIGDAHLLLRISYLHPLFDMAGSFDTEQEWIEVFFGGAKYCNNNTININWNPDNGGASTQNMCYYDGPVTLPADPVKPGYTFMGWKLLENTTTE